MKHVMSWSVFENLSQIPGSGSLHERLEQMKLDGVELFTLIEPIPKEYLVPECMQVHLPYAIDWHSGWEGRDYEGFTGDKRYFSFGNNRKEIIENIHKMIDYAQVLNPEYGVLHAGNTDIRQVLMPKHKSDDMKIISDFCDMINAAAKSFPNGEPPFTICFENLWWEGLKLRNPVEWEVMEDKIEFDNWGFVLDTGHLMNTCENAFDEESAINGVLDIVRKYPQKMKDRIKTLHLQLSTSAEFRQGIKEDTRHNGESWDDFLGRQMTRATTIDQHKPFRSDKVREIVETINPKFINHELVGANTEDMIENVKLQRSLFV